MKTEAWFVMVKCGKKDKKWHYHAGIPVKENGKTSKEIKSDALNILIKDQRKYPEYRFKLRHEFL